MYVVWFQPVVCVVWFQPVVYLVWFQPVGHVLAVIVRSHLTRRNIRGNLRGNLRGNCQIKGPGMLYAFIHSCIHTLVTVSDEANIKTKYIVVG